MQWGPRVYPWGSIFDLWAPATMTAGKPAKPMAGKKHGGTSTDYGDYFSTLAFCRSKSGIIDLALAKIPRFWMDTSF
jgi:hypothetical protein